MNECLSAWRDLNYALQPVLRIIIVAGLMVLAFNAGKSDATRPNQICVETAPLR